MDDTPTDLQCLAAKCVCVRLVHEWAEGEIPVIDVWKNGNGYNSCPDHDWFQWQLYEMEIPRFANIPNKIRYQIDDNMAPILEQIRIWIQYHHSLDFFHDEPKSSSLSEYVVKLVWNHRFKIDYAATAKNILTNENLSPLERFRFASTYCIVDEMEKFRDAMDSVPEWDFIKDPFVVYWSKYLKTELHTITIPVLDDFSIDAIMYIKTSKEFDLWPPLVYFFDKLDSASKSSEFAHIVERYGKRYLKDLLAKLTDKEWNLACRSAVSKIVEKIVQYGNVDDVRFVWQILRSEMDSKNFCGILETMVSFSMRNVKDFEKWTPLLMEIWNSASGELQQSAVDLNVWLNIGEKCIYHIPMEEPSDFRARRQISDPMKFIRLALKSTDLKKRRQFFEKNFFWLIIWAPFVEVDKLMRDFLERYDRDGVELKKEIANSSEIDRSLCILLGFGEFDEFDAVLSFYFSGVSGFLGDDDDDDDKIQQMLRFYKLALIVPMMGLNALSICLYFVDWRPLYEYVKKIVSTAHIAPDAYMITLIELGWFQQIRHLDDKLSKGEMNDLKDCLTTILPPNDSRFEFLKKRFKIHMFKSLFDSDYREERVFNRANVQDFLLWIHDGDEKIVEKNFKQPSLFPFGFLAQLKFCIAEESFLATDSMEEFLKWCFETEEQRRQFKRDMIRGYREHKMIEDLLTRRRYRRSMLYWFFDGDVSLIEKFTDEFGHDPIYPVIPAAEAEAEPEPDADADADDDRALALVAEVANLAVVE